MEIPVINGNPKGSTTSPEAVAENAGHVRRGRAAVQQEAQGKMDGAITVGMLIPYKKVLEKAEKEMNQ